MNNVFSVIAIFLISTSLSSPNLLAQDENVDALFIKKIYDKTLVDGHCYDWLTVLSEDIGGRLTGSTNAESAVHYTKRLMEQMDMDRVELQPCLVPSWNRGGSELVLVQDLQGRTLKSLKCTSLGNSTGSGPKGVTAEVIEVQGLDEVKKLGKAGIEGKIVFYNRPMDPTQIRTFHAYGGAVDQRGSGPALASDYGAVACLVRSMASGYDDWPHTGVTIFGESKHIPAIAISTNDAEYLSATMKEQKVEVYMENHSFMEEEKMSYNVIGEIRGSQYPDQIILVGGHLDSWDIGGGAHDDGAGCVHSLQVIETLKALNYKPKRTIRCVMFMNEENGLGGGRAYRDASNAAGEFHMAAIESDAGGFTPRGFSCDAVESVFQSKYKQVIEWEPLLENYGIHFMKGGSGADINPLKSQEGLLIGFRPDSQRYFDYHHTAADRIDAVNERELKLGAASMTSLVYLLDKYGIE